MEKVKVTLIALLAAAVALAIFFAVVKVAVFLSGIIILFMAVAIAYFTAKFWPRK